MDNLTKEQRRKNMQRIRAKDTSIELRLRKALWHKGYLLSEKIRICQGNQILS